MDSSSAQKAVNSNVRYGDRDLASGLTLVIALKCLEEEILRGIAFIRHVEISHIAHRTWVHRVHHGCTPPSSHDAGASHPRQIIL